MSNMKVEKILERSNELFEQCERHNVENLWEDVSRYMLPNQHLLFNGHPGLRNTPGQVSTRYMFDSTAPKAIEDLSATIHSVMTSPSIKWSKFRFPESELNDDADALSWVNTVNNQFHDLLNASNFSLEVSSAYRSLIAYGNMVIFSDQKERTADGRFGGLRFQALHLSQLAWAEDQNGKPDTVFRRFSMPVRRAIERWGNKISSESRRIAKDEPEKEIEIVHAVFKREASKVKLRNDGLAIPKERPYASLYIEVAEQHIIEEDGFYEFPFFIVRWEKLPGEVYGRGPGSIALPDCKTLNKVKELALRATAKAIDPPLLMEQHNVLGNINLNPAGLTPLRDINGIRPLESASRFDVTQLAVAELKDSIRGLFFLDKFQLPPAQDSQRMTAFEVSQRLDEMQKVMGSVISRLNQEFLDPLVQRVFAMMRRENLLPPAPESVSRLGSSLQIEYVNPLARSQKIADISNIQQWVADLGALAQIRPEVVDNINPDGIARHAARVRGIPDVALADEDAVEEIRQQRAQQRAQQEQLQAAALAADAASKVGGNGGGNVQ